MKGQAVARILFVITLIVTAHAIRPFSMKNLTSHILYSTRSLAVVLPDSTRSSFDYANTLAIALSQNMFVDHSATETSATPQANLLAMEQKTPATTPTPISEAQEVVVVVKPTIKADRSNSAESKRAKPIVKSGETEALASNDIAEVGVHETTADAAAPADEATATGSAPAGDLAEVELPNAPASPNALAFTAELPITLPVNQLNVACALSKIRPVQVELPRIEIVRTDLKLISLHGQIKKADCDKRVTNHIRLIAVIEPPRKPKAEKSANPILECEDEGTEAEVTEAEATGPKDEATEIEENKMKVAPLVPNSAESCTIQP